MENWILESAIMIAAGFLAGALNAVAGGGSFITLPALVAVGLPPLLANATGTAALLPGYVASVWKFRRSMRLPAGISWLTLVVLTLGGGALGAVALLLSPGQLFNALIPWLVLFASGLFAFAPYFLQGGHSNRSRPRWHWLLLCGVCVYGGYFNGGVGIVLLAVLYLLGQNDLHGMNGLKNLMSALLTTVAVVIYGVGGLLDFSHLWLLAASAVAGGYGGAALAYHIPARWLRGFIVLVGLAVAVIFFLR
ncbi:sulfite exporter TauE/SafE family protein [Pseudomaricurvus sp. HS19]|uniref:sulfite exporter TauE/SafE family protein n=1 Tax=Pseudomaricurvus sp. HS19 TaxID=2692626 RepID=UPI00136FE652|nr:sulfite exporter TauE/SafE family protein [Pseudomaricurvus sp. HS19]MYM64053.1 TSUP family transporter [Pseudomaricurvus sp. HS19]